MYRVMIVDKEPFFQTKIKNLLDWKALDCAILALTSDGREALRIFDEAAPEIIITDNKLSEIDGTTFIKQIKQRNQATQIIVISSNSDYHSVRAAMKAGASDYLLKQTIDKEELKQAIREIIPSCVIQRKGIDKQYEDAESYLRRYLIMTKNHLPLEEDKIAVLLQSSLFEPFHNSYQMVYFRVDHINQYYQNHNEAHEEIRHHLYDMMVSSIPDHHNCIISFITNHSGIILFQGCDKTRFLTTCTAMMRNIMQCLQLLISFTVSETNEDLKALFSVFAKLLDRHDMRFYVGDGVLIQVEEIGSFNPLVMEKLDFHTRMLEAVNIRDFDAVREVHKEIMMYVKQQFIAPKNVLDYEIFILNNIEGNELKKGIKLSFDFQEVIHCVQLCETLDQLDQALCDIYSRIEQWLKDERSNRYGKDITEIINFVENNYTQKITLKMLANQFGINESYLSRMFKNQTGKNLIYYVNEKKMYKARELLGNSQIMVKEAAYAVGYDDQFYFNKQFKRFFHVSPTEFRRRIQKQEKK